MVQEQENRDGCEDCGCDRLTLRDGKYYCLRCGVEQSVPPENWFASTVRTRREPPLDGRWNGTNDNIEKILEQSVSQQGWG